MKVLILENKDFLKIFKNSILLLYFAIASTLVLGILFKQIPMTVVDYILNYTNLGSDSTYSDNLFIHITINNIIITSLLLISGLIFSKKLFRFFRIFYLVYMGVIVGFAIAYVANKINVIFAIMLVMPHGIIELTIICLAISVGTIISGEKIENINKRCIIQIVSIIMIAIIIAAFIEAYITSRIAYMFV